MELKPILFYLVYLFILTHSWEGEDLKFRYFHLKY